MKNLFLFFLASLFIFSCSKDTPLSVEAVTSERSSNCTCRSFSPNNCIDNWSLEQVIDFYNQQIDPATGEACNFLASRLGELSPNQCLEGTSTPLFTTTGLVVRGTALPDNSGNLAGTFGATAVIDIISALTNTTIGNFLGGVNINTMIEEEGLVCPENTILVVSDLTFYRADPSLVDPGPNNTFCSPFPVVCDLWVEVTFSCCTLDPHHGTPLEGLNSVCFPC